MVILRVWARRAFLRSVIWWLSLLVLVACRRRSKVRSFTLLRSVRWLRGRRKLRGVRASRRFDVRSRLRFRLLKSWMRLLALTCWILFLTLNLSRARLGLRLRIMLVSWLGFGGRSARRRPAKVVIRRRCRRCLKFDLMKRRVHWRGPLVIFRSTLPCRKLIELWCALNRVRWMVCRRCRRWVVGVAKLGVRVVRLLTSCSGRGLRVLGRGPLPCVLAWSGGCSLKSRRSVATRWLCRRMGVCIRCLWFVMWLRLSWVL